MKDHTNLVVAPDSTKTANQKRLTDIGNVIAMEKNGTVFSFICENGQVLLRFYRKEIVRITLNKENDTDNSAIDSHAVVVDPAEIEVVQQENKAAYTLQTEKVQVKVSKQPLQITIYDQEGKTIVEEPVHSMKYASSGEVFAFKKKQEGDRFYGFGEKAGFLEKDGEKFEMWNSNDYRAYRPDTAPLYQSIPYFMTVRNGRAYGVFFDNTYRSFFDMQTFDDYYSFSAEGGRLDYYVFSGPAPKDVVEQYTYLTGRMPLPPKWSIGYHQSKNSYQSEKEVREVVQYFKEKEIPLDAVYLDIHYMDGYRVFTFDKDQFPDPQQLIADLKKIGVRIVPIVNPGIKRDAEYPVFQSGMIHDMFCKYLDGNYYYGKVWPGNCAFPDLTDANVRSWWGEQYQFYTKLGIEGLWNDMNEPAVYEEEETMDLEVMHANDGNPHTHRALHNIYGMLMAESVYDGVRDQLAGQRPFLLSRSGYAGIQRYAAVWTGDNESSWNFLQLTLPMCMNMGLSGVPFIGVDVGGFRYDTVAELLTRWTQVGVFTPFFRNHSAIHTRHQEPWQFGEEHEKINKKFIELRYQWLPQLYSLFYQASKTGLPVMRPLMMEFPEDPRTEKLSDQFMVGDNVMVAPVLTPGTTDRAVYFPEGEWVDYFTHETYIGGKAHLKHAELDQLPVFVKKGTAIVQGNVVPSTATKQEEIDIVVFASDKDSTYCLEYYDDDGETFAYEQGRYLYIQLEIETRGSELILRLQRQGGTYQPPYSKLNICIHGLPDAFSVKGNGLEKTSEDQFYLAL